MKTQDFKGFIYSDNRVDIFDFDKEHKEVVNNLKNEINEGGIRIIACSECLGAQVNYFTFSIFERIYNFLIKNGLSNFKIAVDNESYENHIFYEFKNANELMQFACNL